LSNGEIAAPLTLSTNTVRHHARNILAKLEITNRTEAVAGAGAATSPARRQVSPAHPPSEPAQPPEAQRVPSTQKTVLDQGGLATVLALIAGYVDAYAFLSYQSYASFMSGNTTQTGLQLGQGQLATAGHDLLPLPPFVVGVFVGTLLLHSSRRHPLRQLFGLVAGLLAVGMAGGYLGPLPGWFSFRISGPVILTYLFVALLHGLWDGLPRIVYLVLPLGIRISMASLLISVIGIVVLAGLWRQALRRQTQDNEMQTP